MLWIKKKTLQNHVIVKEGTYLTLYRLTPFPRAPWVWKHWAQAELGHLLESEPTAPRLWSTCKRKKRKVHSQFGDENHHFTAAAWSVSTQPDLLYWEHTDKVVLLPLSETFEEMTKDGDEWDGIKINGQIWEIWRFSAPFPWGKHSYSQFTDNHAGERPPLDWMNEKKSIYSLKSLNWSSKMRKLQNDLKHGM